MAQNDDVIIVGSLDKKELEKSIQELVDYVGNKTNDMAGKFTEGLDKMKLAMKDFAITQKVSVDLMKEAWRNMSSAFDAMVAAQSTATGNSRGGGKPQYPDNTVGHLEETIRLEEKRRKEMQLGSDALRDQNKLIAEQKNELKEQTTPVASKVLEAALRKQTITLQDAKDKLSMLESIQRNYANSTTLSVTEQNKLTRAITQTKKAIDNLQSKKPKTMKEVLGMDESSVDAIAKKMQALKRVSVDPTNTAQVKQLGDEYQRLKRLQAELMGQNIQMTHSNNYLAQSFGYIRNRLVYAMTLGAATSFAKQVYEIRAQYELLERSLGVLVDSFQRGTETFRELSEMALKSPFTLMELGTAAKQLTAYDFKANEVVDTTRRLADISAALGVPMERLTYNLGQIRAQTRLTARDARDFANAGLPVVKMLADYYSELEGQIVSTGDVYDRMTKRMVSYEDVSSVLFKATDEGGKFFDFQAKQAETLKVQLANLSLAWNNMLNDIGKSNQDLLSAPIHGLKSLFENWQVLSKTVTDLVVILGVAKVAQIAFNLSLSKGTIEQIKNIAANKAATSADYQSVFAKNALTKAQAKYLLATNSGTRSLRKYIAESKLLTTQEYIQTRSAGKLKTAWYGASVAMQGAGKAIRLLGASMAALVPQMAALLAISAIVDVFQTIQERRKEVEEFGNTVRKNAEENAKSIHELLSSLDFESASTLSADEQLKVWERLKEEIELSAAASERFISILLNEPDMGERVDKAKQMLKSLEQIHSVMALWKDDDIVITNDFKILGIGADGLSEDLQDFVDAIKSGDESTQAAIRDTELLESGWRRILDRVYDYSDYSAYIGAGTLTPLGWLKNIGDALGVDWLDSQTTAISAAYQELDDEMNEFVNSLHRQLEKDRITDPFQIKEALEQTLKDTAEAQDWNQEQLLNARILAERKFRNIYKAELASGNQDWVDALDGRTAAWEAWLKYLTTHHNAEFKSMATEQVSEEEWAQDERKRMYEETFETFKKENALAAQEVEQTVNNLNALQVHIRVFYDQPAPLTDVEQDFMARTGQLQRSEYFRTYAKGAKSQLEVVGNLKKAQKKLTEEIATTEKAGGAYADEHLAGMKKRNDALIEMIHSYKALTDAEEKASKGNGKKDVLGDTLQKEIQLINDIQKTYKEYRKAGVDAETAKTAAANEYTKSLQTQNAQLKRFGIKGLTGEQLATMDLHEIRDYYQSMLDIASKLNNVKGVEALEKALRGINVEITKLDYKKITDGLNNELGKLKDEYELAVELDANPELGGIFMDIFDIDPNNLPNTIDAYATKVIEALNRSFEKQKKGFRLDTLSLTDDDLKAYKAESEKQMGAISEEDYKNIEKYTREIRNLRKKDREDTLKQTRELQYKLGDVNEKIAIESKKLEDLQVKYQKETNDEKKRLLDLQIKDQQKVIDELKSQALSLMPEYARVFNSIAEHSAGVARRLQRDLMKVYDSAIFDSASNSWTLTSSNGTQTKLSDTQYRKEREKLTKEMRKSQSNFQKIKEAFKPSDKDGVVDYAKGIELLGDEAHKAADGLRTVTDIMQAMGASDESVEVMGDLANTLDGLGTAAQGYAKLQSGDIIGGASDMIKGVWSSISTWFDNSDKKILQQIKDSETAVKRLELAYVDLQQAVDKAYGTAVIGAKQATLANKELQLAEIQRQIQLEKSRSSKNRDEDKIIDLQKQYKELFYEIQNGYTEIVDDLMGTDVGSFAENLVSSMIDAFKQGEDYMKVFSDKFDEMIDNMIMKSIVSRVVSQHLDAIWEDVNKHINERTKEESEDAAKAQNEAVRRAGLSDDEARQEIASLRNNEFGDYFTAFASVTQKDIDDYKKAALEEEEAMQARLKAASAFTGSDVDYVMQRVTEVMPELGQKLKDILGEYYKFGESSETQLSALQQGIQGITEDTAGALEAITSGMSQQVYYQSTLLEQIRDSVVAMDFDINLGVMSQILLQLQTSYQTQQAIQSILEGWSSPNGMSVRVEMI